MAINITKNEYTGVNAHLQSHFQAHHDWSGFHIAHMNALAANIEPRLPHGYLVDIVLSMQIRENNPDTGEVLECPEPPDDVRFYHCALEIFRLGNYSQPDQRVVRIEALTPNNKSGNGHQQYMQQRHEALRKGLSLIEIDYMHETPSFIKGIAPYAASAAAYPYLITISRWSGQSERFSLDAFGIDEPIAAKAIDLVANDKVIVDFAAAYENAFHNVDAYSYRVDYAQLPENFERYSVVDQKRIRAVMERVGNHPSSAATE